MNAKVLLVDDEDAIREILGLSIADLGYVVETAANGLLALECCESFQPDVVLTDIKMPEMDGIELLKRIKARYCDIEVIMISGHGDMDLAIQSLQHQAFDFITKPVRDELLINALRRAADQVAMRRQIQEHTRNLERIVKEKSAKLVELERRIAVGQVVEGLSSVMRGLVESLGDGPSYFNQLPCFIAVHNRYLEIVAVNQLHKTTLGDMTGKNSWEPYCGRDGSGNACPVWRTIEGGKGLRSSEVLRDLQGREIPVLVHTAPIFNNDNQVELVIEISMDITEVGRLQEELRAAQERFHRLFDSVPCSIAVVDQDFTLVESNKGFRASFGEQRNICCHDLFARRDTPCDHCPTFDTFQSGLPQQHETVVTARDGSQRNVLIQTAPIVDGQGEIVQVMEISTDITQIRQLQDHLSSLGLMLGSMSHGVKGLLTSLDAGMFKVETGLAKGDQQRLSDGWVIVSDKVRRIRKMVLDILYYAKSRAPETSPVCVATLAQDLAAIVGPKARGKGVEFRLEVAPESGQAMLDETAMTSALVNFLENAVDACADDASKGLHAIVLRAGGDAESCVFEVIDNGMGMDEETRTKMFTLFFSSKGSKGTGLGLFIANQVVEQHGGRIVVESTRGQGTRVLVTIPRGKED